MPQIIRREVGPVDYGLMGFTWRENPVALDQALETMNAALENGMSFWNGGGFYGTPKSIA